MSFILKGICSEGSFRFSIIDSKDIVARATEVHSCSAVAAAALGRTLTAASLMGNMMKEEAASIMISINGGGPIGSIIAVSDSEGNVRGYADNPQVELPPKEKGKLDVGRAVGKDGFVTVSRDIGLKEPYIGSTKLVSGEIAEDMAMYLAESEQTESAIGLGVLVSSGEILSAGGFLIQLLPGTPIEVIEKLEENIKNIPPVTSVLFEKDAYELVGMLTKGFDAKILTREEVSYKCTCSRKKTIDALISCGEAELEDMILKGENTEVGCIFCDEKQIFTPDDVKEILKSIRREQQKI